MNHLTLYIEKSVGESLKVYQKGQPMKPSGDLEDLLDFYARQGWQFIGSLPEQWQIQCADQFDMKRITGLELAVFTLIFQERDNQ